MAYIYEPPVIRYYELKTREWKRGTRSTRGCFIIIFAAWATCVW